MSKVVITHHALHEDEGIYRLVYAIEEQYTVTHSSVNPDYDPEDEDSQPTVSEEETVTELYDYREVVWDAEDPKWQDRDPDDIAAEQREIVSVALTSKSIDAVQAEADAIMATKDLGSVGQEL